MTAYAIVLALIILLFGLLLGWGLEQSFNDRLQASLESVAFDIRHDLGSIPPSSPLLDPDEAFAISPVYIEVYRSQKDGTDRRVLYSSNMQDRQLPCTSEAKLVVMDISFISTSDESAVYSIKSIHGAERYRISVATPIDKIDDLLEDFMRLFVLFGIVVYLIALYLGHRLLDRVLSPMEQITSTAASITHSNLSRRIPLPLVEDEFFVLAKTFNTMLDRIESAFEKVKRFNANVSHELKTPLTIIQGEAEVALKKKRDTQAYEKVLRSIVDETHEVHHMIDSMLLLSRSDVVSLKKYMVPVKLDVLVRDVIEAKRTMVKKKQLHIESSELKPISIVAEPMLLREAIANVFDNAIKYTPEHKSITVSLTGDDESVDLCIEDEGIGIGKAALEKAFEPFWREDSAHSKLVAGHGLGLSIVKWVMEVHDGSVTIESEKGRGTRCLLHFKMPAER